MSESSDIRTCGVCAAPLKFDHPYKFYGAVVAICPACRFFFRRNAHREDQLTCKSGTGACPITNDDNRRNGCRQCRLKICLGVGMRLDLMLDDEDKKRRFRKFLKKKKEKFYHFDSPDESDVD